MEQTFEMRKKNLAKPHSRKIRRTLKKLSMLSCVRLLCVWCGFNRNLMLCMHHVLLVLFTHTTSSKKKNWYVRHSRYMSRLYHKTMTFIYFRRFRCLHSLYNSKDREIYHHCKPCTADALHSAEQTYVKS